MKREPASGMGLYVMHVPNFKNDVKIWPLILQNVQKDIEKESWKA
jgi:hypothetical protein